MCDVREVLAQHLPGYRVDSVVPAGEGLENVAFEVNGELIVRFSTEPDPARRTDLITREADLLATVAGLTPLAVPVPRFTAADAGCLGYGRIPGAALIDVPEDQRLAHGPWVAETLGELLTALHSAPVERMAALVGPDDVPMEEWRDGAAETYATVAAHVPPAYRRAVSAFLGTAPPATGYAPVFTHNDLGVEHVLVERWAVTGVIDWSDAAIADPARDFGKLYRDLGPAAVDAAVRTYRTATNDVFTLMDRAVFYARCGALEDLAYGLETGRKRYAAKSVTALEWLFT
jgi:aminoglycoside phosphotransferase (APT) family kinase protein